jgi:hypothetical protein
MHPCVCARLSSRRRTTPPSLVLNASLAAVPHIPEEGTENRFPSFVFQRFSFEFCAVNRCIPELPWHPCSRVGLRVLEIPTETLCKKSVADFADCHHRHRLRGLSIRTKAPSVITRVEVTELCSIPRHFAAHNSACCSSSDTRLAAWAPRRLLATGRGRSTRRPHHRRQPPAPTPRGPPRQGR